MGHLAGVRVHSMSYPKHKDHAGHPPLCGLLWCPRYNHESLPLHLDRQLPDIHSLFDANPNGFLMPPYYFQDNHYFYRTALRGLNICTSISPLYA
jgi:hypothetical protein